MTATWATWDVFETLLDDDQRKFYRDNPQYREQALVDFENGERTAFIYRVRQAFREVAMAALCARVFSLQC